MAISSCTIRENTATNAGQGGGVFVSYGTVTITSSSIYGHLAQNDGQGGGVFVQGGTVAISSCTISGNTANSGGGVRIDGGTVTFSACIITGNRATGGWSSGGGVIVGDGTVTFSSCTISGNTADWGPNVRVGGGTVCSWATPLTGVYGTVVSACPAPPPQLSSPPPLPPHSPQSQVSTSAGLTSALANTAVGHIVLAPGTYNLTAELSITRSVILEAAVAGSVVLNAQASSSSQRRVLNINPGSSGVVQLIRLSITGGYASSGGGVFVQGGTVAISSCTVSGNTATYVRAHVSIALMGRFLTCLPRLSLAQLRLTLLSTSVGMRRRGL